MSFRAKIAVALVTLPALAFRSGAEQISTSTAVRVSDAIVVAEDSFFGPPAAGSVVRWGGGAAADLTNALSRIVGRRIALYSESTAPSNATAAICLGNLREAREALGPCDLPNLAFRIKAVPGRVFIYAKTGTGTSYGVTEFLARFCGYRQMTLSGEEPYVPNPDLKVPVCDFTDRPAIYSRSVYAGGWKGAGPLTRQSLAGDRAGYPRRLRFHYRTQDIEPDERLSTQTRGAHSLYDYIPPEKYFKDHPECFSMDVSGKRRAVRNSASQICFTCPLAFDIVYSSLARFVAADREKHGTGAPRIYDMTQMDSCDYLCLCPECRKVIAKYNRVPGGHAEGGDAGLQLEFVNRLARKIRAEYPDVKIRTFAYVSTETVPVGIVPEDNVIIWLCDLYTQSNHMLPLSHPLNAPRKKIVEDWAKIAKHLEIWDYMLYNRHYSRGRLFPEVNVDAIYSDMRFFHDLGIRRYFMESEFGGQPFYELNTYVMARCCWNPDCDLEKVIDEFCTAYGAGAGKMREAIDMVRTATRTETPKSAGEFMNRVIPWRRIGFYEAFRAKVGEAYALAGDPLCRARIARVLAATDDEMSRLRGGTEEEKAKAQKESAAALRFRIEDAVSEFKDPQERKKVEEEILAEEEKRRQLDGLRFKDMPPGVTAGSDGVFCMDFRRWKGQKVVRKVDDPESETGKAILFDAGKTSASPMQCGFYDYGTKESSYHYLKIPAEDNDGVYRWYRVGVGHVGRQSIFWHAGWWGHFLLDHCFTACDGAPVDLNWFEAWVSLARKDGRIRIDRFVLNRCKAPDKGK